jgi:hypothetical protein
LPIGTAHPFDTITWISVAAPTGSRGKAAPSKYPGRPNRSMLLAGAVLSSLPCFAGLITKRESSKSVESTQINIRGLKRDAYRLLDIRNRIRVYQFETPELTRRFGHLLAHHDD